jgi:hypothetical protein
MEDAKKKEEMEVKANLAVAEWVDKGMKKTGEMLDHLFLDELDENTVDGLASIKILKILEAKKPKLMAKQRLLRGK